MGSHEGTVHALFPFGDPLPGDSPLVGEPFATTGHMPAAIIASTEDCDIVSIDSRTGVVTVLADSKSIHGKAIEFYACSDQGTEYQEYSGPLEIAPGFIEDVEWADPKYVLIGNCCEPAVGRFEVLDIESHDRPYGLSVNGSYPSISNSGNVAFFDGVGLGIVPFDVNVYDSDRYRYYFRLVDDVSYYTQPIYDTGEWAESASGGPRRSNVNYRINWVADNMIAVGFHTSTGDSVWRPWVALMDVDTGPVAANSRGVGWMHPTGDGLGNLVVAEQQCFLWYLSECMGSPSKVVVVDPETLLPLHEVNVEDTIVDMDLERGWLLVTLVDGQLGTLDLATGAFNHLADGIRNAVWQE